MNDSPRNEYRIDEQFEVMPQLPFDNASGFVAIHFTHDYVSTESQYGTSVLKNYIHSLTLGLDKEPIVLLSDKAVRLIEEDELLNDFILLSEHHPIYVSESALKEYSVSIPEAVSMVIASDSEFIQFIIELHPIVIS